jgi:hypothetical protein
MDVLQCWMNDFALHISSGMTSLDHVLREFCNVISKHETGDLKKCVLSRKQTELSALSAASHK